MQHHQSTRGEEKIMIEELMDQIITLKKYNAWSSQRQTRIETKINKIIDLLIDKKVRDRERGRGY